MSFWESKKIKATKKSHRCEYCHAIIPVGSSCNNEAGTYEGDFNHYYLCQRCLVFMDVFVDRSEPELGEFVDEVYDSDLLDCPKCGERNHREYQWMHNMQAIAVVCDNCNHEHIVDLSLAVMRSMKLQKQS